jgi:hypothetical protein
LVFEYYWVVEWRIFLGMDWSIYFRFLFYHVLFHHVLFYFHFW